MFFERKIIKFSVAKYTVYITNKKKLKLQINVFEISSVKMNLHLAA